MRLSIVIPAFNEEALLRQTLERIQLALPGDGAARRGWEIIVCDNHSTDRTPAIAAVMGARVVFEPHRQIARARNAGAAIARGEWLLFIDADSYPPPALMAEVWAAIDAGDAIGCGTTVVVTGGTLFNKLRLERLNPLFRLFNWSGGAFLLCRQDAFVALGGFSQDLYAYEEIDFVGRLKRYGRQRGLKFTVLHRHPLVTSGRRGDYGLRSLATLFASNFAAVILFALYYVLPKWWVRKLGSLSLGYWYDSRR